VVRFRRIADRERIFFVTTNLGRGVAHLSARERDLLLALLKTKRDHGAFWLFGYVVMPEHLHLLLRPQEESHVTIMRDLK